MLLLQSGPHSALQSEEQSTISDLGVTDLINATEFILRDMALLAEIPFTIFARYFSIYVKNYNITGAIARETHCQGAQ